MSKHTAPKSPFKGPKPEPTPDPKCPHANLDALMNLLNERVALTGTQWMAVNNSADLIRAALPARKA